MIRAGRPSMRAPRPEPELREVVVAGGALPVERWGRGPVLILLHGWALDRRVWRPLAAELAARFTLLVPDRRGFGRATAPPGLAAEADDLRRIASAFGVERFALAGLSQGGRVALAFAASRPAELAALIAIGAPLDGVARTASEAAEAEPPIVSLRSLRRTGARGPMRQAIRAHPLMALENRGAAPILDAILADYDGRDLLDGQAALPVVADELAGLDLPALALTGAAEPAWRHRTADAIAAAIPGARRARIPGAGHLSPLDAPVFCAALIRDFLEASFA